MAAFGRLPLSRALLALIVALLACTPMSARAQSLGRLFFLHSDTGHNMLGGVDQFGHFHTLASGTDTRLQFRPVWAVTGDGILCYDFGGSGGAIVQLDGRALPRFFGGITLSGGWDRITGIGNYLFFLNNTTHGGAVVSINPDGSTTQTQGIANLSTWTDVLATENYLVFYNSDTGALAAGVISNVQQFAQTATSTGIVNGARFATLGDDVMLYDFTSGNFQIFHLMYDGNLSDSFSLSASGVFAAGYTFIVTINRNVLLYNDRTGATLIGAINQSGANVGAWKQTQALKLFKGWTSVLRTGQFLTFYNQISGELSVGYISAAGKWVQTDYQANVGTGYNSVAATAR